MDEFTTRIHALPAELYNQIYAEVLLIEEPPLRTHITATYRLPMHLRLSQASRKLVCERYFGHTVFVFTSVKLLCRFIKVVQEITLPPRTRVQYICPGQQCGSVVGHIVETILSAVRPEADWDMDEIETEHCKWATELLSAEDFDVSGEEFVTFCEFSWPYGVARRKVRSTVNEG